MRRGSKGTIEEETRVRRGISFARFILYCEFGLLVNSGGFHSLGTSVVAEMPRISSNSV